MPILPGERFVARQSAARGAVDNTVPGLLEFDTTVIVEGGYAFDGTEVEVDSAGRYLVIHGTGEVSSGDERAVGTNSIAINGTSRGVHGLSTHRYVRNAGQASRGVSFGAAICELDEGDKIASRTDGDDFASAVGAYTTAADEGGGLQVIRLPIGDFTELELPQPADINVTDAASVRPWTDNTFNGSALLNAQLAPNAKYLICWAVQFTNTNLTRCAGLARVSANGSVRQYGSAYLKDANSQGAAANGLFLYQAGDTAETLQLEATMEMDPVLGVSQAKAASLQIFRLPQNTRWMHADADAATSNTQRMENSNFLRLFLNREARAASSFVFNFVFNEIRNNTNATLPVLAIGWQNWDRQAQNSARKVPTTRIAIRDTPITYGWGGAYNRGNATGPESDAYHAAYSQAAMFDLPAGTNGVSFQARHIGGQPNHAMGIFGAGNRRYIGLQVLDLRDLDTGNFAVLNTLTEREVANPIVPTTSGSVVVPIGTATTSNTVGDVDADRTEFTPVRSTPGSSDPAPTEIHNVDLAPLGAINRGDGLLVVFGIDGNSALFIPSDFEILLDAQGPDGEVRAVVVYKKAVGTEGPILQFGTNEPTTSIHRAFRFAAADIFDWDQSPPVGITQGGNNAIPTHPALTVPWPPLVETWWLGGYLADEGTSVPQAFPGFTFGQFRLAGAGEAFGMAEVFGELRGTLDAGTFLIIDSVEEQWTAWTVAVRPADTGASPLGAITTASENETAGSVDPIVSSTFARIASTDETNAAGGVRASIDGTAGQPVDTSAGTERARVIKNAGTGTGTTVVIQRAREISRSRPIGTAIDVPREVDVDHDVFFLDRHRAVGVESPDDARDIGREVGETDLVAPLFRTLDATTKEKRAVDIITPGDPSAEPPEFALTLSGTREPDSFLPGEYVGKWDQNTGRIRALSPLFGAGQVLSVQAGRTYYVWVRWTLGNERPVRIYEAIKVV